MEGAARSLIIPKGKGGSAWMRVTGEGRKKKTRDKGMKGRKGEKRKKLGGKKRALKKGHWSEKTGPGEWSIKLPGWDCAKGVKVA